MRIAVILLSFVLFMSCKQSVNLNTIRDEEAYSLINDFITDSLVKTDLLAVETVKFWNSDISPKGPPQGYAYYCTYNKTLFDTLISLHIIDSLDINPISKQLSLAEESVWDTSKVSIRVFSRNYIDQLCQKETGTGPFDHIWRLYNSSTFLILSNPIFLKDKNTILLSVNFACDGLCGNGDLYVFRKINGMWTVLYKKWTWIQ